MKKIISLVKAGMTENMNLFRINTKNQSEKSKKIFPIVIALLFLFSMWSYANVIMEPLVEVHCEIVLLTLFIAFSVILTLMEGIYKAGNLLFNCKDDNLLLSLPIKKSTVLFLRLFKFYIFEVLYNTLFLLPAMLVYIRYVNVSWTFYIVSILALLILPVIPIVISCVIGGITAGSSAKFKYKNFAQIVFTTILLLGIMYLSFNLEGLIASLAEHATSVNDLITKLYYPAGMYIKLITEFNVIDLIIFVGIHIILSFVTVLALGKIYFKINSKVKVVKSSSTSQKYKIKTRKPIVSLIKKELNRFATSPVFVINAGFGLVLFIAGCILLVVKFDSLTETLSSIDMGITIEQLKSYIPVVQFGLICFAALMSSITCSMISLEGKTFSILKSLPVKPFTIIMAKVMTAVLIMIPFILIGNLITLIAFGFNIIEIIMLLITSFVLPIVSETLGIIVNLKYPKMDAETDTEVVKQSMSTMIATFMGMILTGLSIARISISNI